MRKKNLIIILLLPLIFVVNLSRVAEAKRIVSLAPSITEILFLLDLEKQIVGVTANCDYPKEAKRIEKTGRIYRNISPDLFIRPGPRLVEGLEEIAKILHPKIFPPEADEKRG